MIGGSPPASPGDPPNPPIGSLGLEAAKWCLRRGLPIFREELCEAKCALGELIRCIPTLQDSRFNAEVDLITGYKTHSILCLPIKNHRDEVSRFLPLRSER